MLPYHNIHIFIGVVNRNEPVYCDAYGFGKGEKNRTPTCCFGDSRDTISLHPHKKAPQVQGFVKNNEF